MYSTSRWQHQPAICAPGSRTDLTGCLLLSSRPPLLPSVDNTRARTRAPWQKVRLKRGGRLEQDEKRPVPETCAVFHIHGNTNDVDILIMFYQALRVGLSMFSNIKQTN